MPFVYFVTRNIWIDDPSPVRAQHYTEALGEDVTMGHDPSPPVRRMLRVT